MKVLSVNVGLPTIVEYRGNKVSTGIFKEQVGGTVKVGMLNLDGDAQADLTVHGGPDKAVYSYPDEHYPYWRNQYPDLRMDFGMFGENLTTEGMLEEEVNIGDEFVIGSSRVSVTQPRMPCFKLGIKFGSEDIIRRFFLSTKSGIYFRVLEEGEVKAGDEIKRVREDENKVTIHDVLKIYGDEHNHKEVLERALKISSLPISWKEHYRQVLRSLEN